MLIVCASRIPPRQLGDRRLTGSETQQELNEVCLLKVSKAIRKTSTESFVEHFRNHNVEDFLGFSEVFPRPLGAVLAGVGSFLGPLGRVSGASWGDLGSLETQRLGIPQGVKKLYVTIKGIKGNNKDGQS